MNPPLYTAALGAFLLALQAGLMLSVGFYRTRGIFVGLDDDPTLERLVRRHGNLAENAGLFLAALALLEIIAGQSLAVAGLCLGFALARLLHAIGFSSLAGSHGEGLNGIRRLFLLARSSGAVATAVVGFLAAGALLAALLGPGLSPG